MNAIVACVILVAALTLLVVFTMAVENWASIVQPLAVPPTAADDDPDPPPEDPVPPVPLVPQAPRRDPASTFRVQLVHPVPAAGIPDDALRATPTSLLVRDAGTADVIAGLLFAAHAVSRRAGADRAAAWVTAAATPPSLDPSRFPAGVDLRGRPGRVAELLAADDAGVSWLTLQHDVDIARGIARSPVRQPTLVGLLVWWESTRSLPSIVSDAEVARLADAVDRVQEQLADTPWDPVVRHLGAVLDGARDRCSPLLLATSVPTVSDGPDGRQVGSDGRGPGVARDTAQRSGSSGSVGTGGSS